MGIDKLKISIFFTCFVFVLPINASTIGYSGMTQIDSNSYLVVHDKKVYENGIRVAVLKVRKNYAPLYLPVTINDWMHKDGQSSDLESACALPNRESEFLLAEAGYWEGKYGRIFHIKLTGDKASIVDIYRIPRIKGSTEQDPDGDNFEGMICIEKGKRVLVVLGERGGSDTYKNGLLRIGVLDYIKSSISWSQYSNDTVEISAPGLWNNPEKKRSISDLFLDKNNVIWAVATQDKSDEGPFKSIIYKAAIVSDKSGHSPIIAIQKTKPYWTIDGFKVESLSGPTDLIQGSFMSFGTEDESYDGNWRPLFRPIE